MFANLLEMLENRLNVLVDEREEKFNRCDELLKIARNLDVPLLVEHEQEFDALENVIMVLDCEIVRFQQAIEVVNDCLEIENNPENQGVDAIHHIAYALSLAVRAEDHH